MQKSQNLEQIAVLPVARPGDDEVAVGRHGDGGGLLVVVRGGIDEELRSARDGPQDYLCGGAVVHECLGIERRLETKRQFALGAGENIWAGKCPIYVFDEVEHFRKFSTDVVKLPEFASAGGFHHQRGDGFCIIVMNRVPSRRAFHEVLVHEATHAFLGRYLTNRAIVEWVNEGLAETMASRLVPGASAARRYVDATREAVKKDRNVSHVFRDVRLEAFDYGVVQSLVRYLIARDRLAFVEFIRRMKAGRPEPDALAETYGLTHAALVRDWKQAAKRAPRR